MNIPSIPFTVTDWASVPAELHAGAEGTATWRVRRFGDIRVRMVDYSPGYLADHWCERGHILLVLRGTLITQLKGQGEVTLTAGMSYEVATGIQPHLSKTATGASLFIVD